MTTGKSSPAKAPHPAEPRPDAPRGWASRYPAGDRLRSAGWLVVTAVGIVAAGFLTVALDGIRGRTAQPDAAAFLYRAIGLNELALTPTSRQGRRPDSLPMRIDGRFLPVLPQENPGVLPLLDAGQLAAPRRVTAP